MLQIKRGQIWTVDMGEGIGSEQKFERPVVVLQNNIGNYFAPTVTIAPLTSQSKKWLPTHVILHKTKCLMFKSTVLIEQINTKSKDRFMKYIGEVNEEEMLEIDEAIKIQVGLVDLSKGQKIIV